jgi:DNA repair exonuclease SbcCD nuclease subunit
LVKFVHTADWQLGMGFAGRSRPEELRKERLSAIGRVLDVARQEDAGFIIVAGDCFETNRISRTLLYEAREALRNAPCPVFILPGNHDPLSQDSIYTGRDEWRNLPPTIRVLTEPRPVTVGGVTLYPCPCAGKTSAQDPTAWIPARRPEDGVRIGVAHGSWQVLPELPADDHPVPSAAAQQRDLDYLALGHWHSTFPDAGAGRDGRHAEGRTFYSGTHERAGFGERDSGNVLIVEIDGPTETPVVRKRRTSRFVWRQEEFEVRDETSVRALQDSVQNMDEPGQSLVRITLKGVVPPTIKEETARVLDEIRPRFFSLEVDDRDLVTTLAEMDAGELPSGLLRRVAARLIAYATGDTGCPPAGWSPGPALGRDAGGRIPEETARRALQLLFGRFDLLKRGGQQ